MFLVDEVSFIPQFSALTLILVMQVHFVLEFCCIFSQPFTFSTGFVLVVFIWAPEQSPQFRNRSHIWSPLTLVSWDYIFNYLAIQKVQEAIETFQPFFTGRTIMYNFSQSESKYDCHHEQMCLITFSWNDQLAAFVCFYSGSSIEPRFQLPFAFECFLSTEMFI